MIQITFTPSTPEQAAVLAQAMTAYLTQAVNDDAANVAMTVATPAAEQESEAPKPTPVKRTRKSTSAETPAADASTQATAEEVAAAAQESTAEEQAPAAQSVPAPAPASTAVTLEQVRAVLAGLSQTGKTSEVKQLLTQFGAAKLTDIPADKYAELLAAAQEI